MVKGKEGGRCDEGNEVTQSSIMPHLPRETREEVQGERSHYYPFFKEGRTPAYLPPALYELPVPALSRPVVR